MKRRISQYCGQRLMMFGVVVLLLQVINEMSYVTRLESKLESTKPCYTTVVGNHSPVTTEFNNTIKEEEMAKAKDFKVKVNRTASLLYGHFRKTKSFLTIAIPTIQRPGVNYLEQTLTTLIRNTHEDERKEIVITVFLADSNRTWISKTARTLAINYRHHIQTGLLQIFHNNEENLPDFKSLPRTFNDTYKRFAWRCKQNIDYAFMFLYCKDISTYYLQLEDDVTIDPKYFSLMKNFILKTNSQKQWYSLDFSTLGFIGKLIHSSDLHELANFILMFYWLQPGDNLFGYLKRIKTQFKDIKYKPALFQHIGIISSLDGKRQFLKEPGKKLSAGSPKRFYNPNPPAEIKTSIKSFKDFLPYKAYDMSDDYFWGVSPKEGSNFSIILHKPENITRIYFAFGSPKKKTDVLESAVIKVSPYNCRYYTVIGEINNDLSFDTNIKHIQLPQNIKCILLDVTKSQNKWFVLREISIFRLGDVVEENPYYSKKKKQNKKT